MRMFGSDANDPEDSEGYSATVRARLGNDKELKIPVVDNESYMKAALHVLSSNAGGGYARACRSCKNLHPIDILVCPATGKSVVTGEPLSFGAGIEGGYVVGKMPRLGVPDKNGDVLSTDLQISSCNMSTHCAELKKARQAKVPCKDDIGVRAARLLNELADKGYLKNPNWFVGKNEQQNITDIVNWHIAGAMENK